MKRFLLTLLTFALIAGALVLALRPVAIEQLRLWKGARAVSGYRKAADALDTLDCGTRLALARENSGLPENGEALDALDLNGDGVVAVLSRKASGFASLSPATSIGNSLRIFSASIILPNIENAKRNLLS